MKRICFLLFLILSFTGVSPAAKAQSAGVQTDGYSPSPGSYSRTYVMLFYVDGLRPDNVDEMAAAHRIPHIEEIFYQKGLRFKNMFTTFPSNTLISNGLFMTGKWPATSGLKSQALFERFEVEGQRHLEYFVDRIGRPDGYPRYFNLLTQREVAPRLLKHNHVKTLFDYLGERFAATVLPISPQAAPLPWLHVASNEVEHFYKIVVEAPDEIDQINAQYAKDYMLTDERAEIFMIWFPGLDEMQHASKTGQFGEVRDHLVLIDGFIGEIAAGMRKKIQPEERLITVLFSDHGAVGGENGVYNQPFHIARDYFYQKLRMNVRGPDFSMTYPGTDTEVYTFIDNMGRGQAKVFLPVADQTSGNWSRRNTFYELTHYGRGPNRAPVNLITALTGIDLSERNAFPGTTDPHPVELLMVKVSPSMIYVRRFNGSEALLLREDKGPQEMYRYLPVENFRQDPDGTVHYSENAAQDPFLYREDPNFNPPGGKEAFLKEPHGEKEWLKATYRTQYPDAPTSLWKSFGWSAALQADSAISRDPDIYLSAAPGWNFRIEPIESADHGSLRADSVRTTFMMSGPGLKQGELEAPHRLIEVPATLFELIGDSQETDFDEPAMRDIYEN